MFSNRPSLPEIARQRDWYKHIGCDGIAEMIDAEYERRERRLLFFAAMRQPEMRWVREAFKHLRNDTRHDWREIREIEIDPPVVIDGYSGAWAMRTDRFVTLLICPERYDGHEDFMTVDHHDANNAYCECWWCYDATMEKRRAESEVTNG